MVNRANDFGSFKDPFGSIYTINDSIYRSVLPAGIADFDAARHAGVHDRLIKSGLLIPHELVDAGDEAPEGTVYSLSHPCLPFVSYPWEWPFSMLKDAAILHLDVMEVLIPIGFWLRDASAFNVQYGGNGLILIDTLSIGKRMPGSPWVAYGQFCSHFLAPLSMAAYSDIRMMSLWRSYIDGFPLDLAIKALPFHRKYRIGLLMHLFLHARFQARAQKQKNLQNHSEGKKPKVSDRGLIGLVRSLRRAVSKINWNGFSKLWVDYESFRTYRAEDISKKSEFVDGVIHRLQPKMVWDFGANLGEFSQIAASAGSFVVSIEKEPACTELLYREIRQKKYRDRILPLTMDLANPSPGLGWNGRERLSLSDRGPADLILALALIHHLVLSAYVPFEHIARWFSSLARYLLVEFIPPTDTMVKKLLANRDEGHLPYSMESFRESFGKRFDFEDEFHLKNGRMLFLCRKR
ncbi:MAG: hypothetical protein A2V65_07775 [Deltaproteobacteria bacterium RBG_13_49_15]|nr:MAG: hypothetical protein A2V65_07775 [Deltaproteobacteria bacterium RBG_13_49_15]